MKHLAGRPLDGLTLKERTQLRGKWVALESYTPETLPLRIIEAVGDSTPDCIRQLRERKLDPLQFEFTLMRAPY